jgi:hypothetical protein
MVAGVAADLLADCVLSDSRVLHAPVVATL